MEEDLEITLGDVKLVDGVLLFLTVSSSKPCSSIGGSLQLVNLVCDRTCLLVLTEHVAARLASCN
jgi:hypothetical protein